MAVSMAVPVGRKDSHPLPTVILPASFLLYVMFAIRNYSSLLRLSVSNKALSGV